MRARTRPATLAALTIIIIASSLAQAAWVVDGIPVCLPIGQQNEASVASDGAGGVFVVWSDSRAPVNTDIYVQKIDADGTILTIDTGLPICQATGLQSSPLIVSDGAGGAIIAWQDYRSGSTNDIYAQKIDSFGFIQWAADGVAICTGQTGLALRDIIPDGAGGAIIAWHDRRNFDNDVFAQRIGAGGTVMWPANGVAVASLAEHQQNPSLATDGAGGAIITWEDRRNGAPDIYAQRIDASGSAVWTANGTAICTAAYAQTAPRIIEDGAGGAIIAWSDIRNNVFFGIYAQRVTPLGTALWTTDGITIVGAMYDQMYCEMVPVGSGEAVITNMSSGGSASATDWRACRNKRSTR